MGERLCVTEASAADAELVLRVMLAAFEEYRHTLRPRSSAHDETPETVRAAMAEGGAVLAWEDGVAVGSGRYRVRPDHLYVERLSVLPQARGRGIAGAMLEHIEALAPRYGRHEMRLSVRAALPRNLALYERHGYVEYERHPHPRGPFDVVEMRKWLRPVSA